jgi:membrane-bound lytic murein transglycosylase A
MNGFLKGSFMRLLICLLFSFSLYAQIETPTERVLSSLSFIDDMEFENLELAISRQLKALPPSRLSGTITYGDTTYPRSFLKESLEEFLKQIKLTQSCFKVSAKESCLAEFNQKINQEFDLYKPIPSKAEPGFNKKETTLFTVYFSPDFKGSRTANKQFTHPIYALPKSAELQGQSRDAIDFGGVLRNKGLELFWVEESLFELYILHVEGGGRIKVQNPDGTETYSYLSYAGANGQKFQFIKKYMVEKGFLRAEEASVDNQRDFIENNPHLAREIYASNPSYIFFKETHDEPLGVDNIPLTEGRSLAIDTRIYKHVGVINYVKTKKGTRLNQQTVMSPFSRFFISQDTGGAIRGNARCDLYLGFGAEAETAAHNTKSMGEQYFLIKKMSSR